MRVLMLGWDFSPRLSGGVGSACRGLAVALARASAPIRAEVLFVLPRLRGDEEPEDVRLLAGDAPALSHARAPAVVPALALAASAPAPVRPSAAREGSGASPYLEEASSETRHTPRADAPSLPRPEEALRLLTIDSPLRPYLSSADYAQVVRGMLARIRRTAPARAPESASTKSVRARREQRPAPTTPSAASALAPQPEASAAPVPPYGRTLIAEVERYARAALALAQAESFDVVHAHDWMTFPAGLLLQERTGKPLVVHFHSCEAERRGARGASDVRAIEQAAIDAAERVVCVSEASARTLRAHYALEYAKLRVLHNAFEPLPGHEPRAKRTAPVVLYLGRLSEQKGPDVFLRAAARVLARQPAARFVLAGEGELYPELTALARELGLERRVRFTGFVSSAELARTYAGADVYVLSSAAEPFGISALEALSLGVPTIVPKGAGVTEVVRSVLRFEPLDVEDLADKIVALLEQPALRTQLSAAGLREVKKLRWERPARALRGIYDEIVRAAP